MYVHQRLAYARELLAPILESNRTLMYICGIAGMELGVFQTLAEILDSEARDQYVRPDPEAGPPSNWDRKMFHKSLHLSKRTFLEVY